MRGRASGHHRFMPRLLLRHVDAIDAAVTRIDQEVDARVEPFRAAVQLSTAIPGVSELSAGVILAEIGRDMPGSNWHVYVYDPDGHTNEMYYGIEQIGWNRLSKPREILVCGAGRSGLCAKVWPACCTTRRGNPVCHHLSSARRRGAMAGAASSTLRRRASQPGALPDGVAALAGARRALDLHVVRRRTRQLCATARGDGVSEGAWRRIHRRDPARTLSRHRLRRLCARPRRPLHPTLLLHGAGRLGRAGAAGRRTPAGRTPWPQTFPPLSDTYVDQVFQGPLG